MSRRDAEKRPRGFVVIPLEDDEPERRASAEVDRRAFDIVIRLRLRVSCNVSLEDGEAHASS